MARGFVVCDWPGVSSGLRYSIYTTDDDRRTPQQQRLGGRSSHSRQQQRHRAAGDARMEVFEGNPVGKAVWDFVWKLPVMQRGEQGAPIQFGDVAYVLRKNIEQIYGACVPGEA